MPSEKTSFAALGLAADLAADLHKDGTQPGAMRRQLCSCQIIGKRKTQRI